MSEVFAIAEEISRCPKEAKAVLVTAYEKAVELGGGQITPLMETIKATAIQCNEPELTSSPYMTGVANGMLLALNTLLSLGVFEPFLTDLTAERMGQ